MAKDGASFLMARAITQTILEFLGVVDDKSYRIQYYSSDKAFAQEPSYHTLIQEHMA